MIRKRCVRRGHKWSTAPMLIFYQFCTRVFCDGCRVNPNIDMPVDLRAALEAVVLEHMAARLREESR